MYKFQIQDENTGMIKHINDFVLHTDSTTKKAITLFTNTTTLVTNLENKSWLSFIQLEFYTEDLEIMLAFLGDVREDYKRSPWLVSYMEVNLVK